MESEAFFITLMLDAWNSKVQQASKLFESLSGEALYRHVAPGRNTVIFIIGHLIAVSDRMIEALGFGERQSPELDKLFLTEQRLSDVYPLYPELKAKWDAVNLLLSDQFSKMTTADWLSRHAYVSEADFALEPKRNKATLLLSRTTHLAHHIGQLALVRPGD